MPQEDVHALSTWDLGLNVKETKTLVLADGWPNLHIS